MNFFDVQMYAIIKLILLLFLAISIFLIVYKPKPSIFLFLAGACSALAYFFLVNDLNLSFWGLQGDETTITAMYNTIAHVGPWSDFAYHSLTPFYPPGFFWLFGFVGWLMDWNGVMIAKFASCLFFLCFPLCLYWYQKYLGKSTLAGKNLVGEVFYFLVPILIITILDKDLLIGKPYEVIAVSLTIFWFITLYLKISQKKWNYKQTLLYGFIAGIIFMVYYLWLVFAALALLLMGIFEKGESRVKYFWIMFKTMLVGLLTASPFLIPLIISYAKNGMESWQTAFFTPQGMNLWMPFFNFNSWTSIILLFGLAVLIYYRQQPVIRQLGYLFLTAFIWWGMGLASLLFLKTPFQEFRGFYILAPVILVIASAYGFERLWHYLKGKNNHNLLRVILIIGLLFFASQSMFGFFVDDPYVKLRRTESKDLPIPVGQLVKYLQTNNSPTDNLTLHTIPQAVAFVPINHLIYFNQHNNNPASIFSQRYQYVESLSKSKTTEELYQKIKACPFGKLDRLIFYGDKNNYYLFFHLDKIIKGIETKEIRFDKKLFTSQYFDQVYDQSGFTVFMVKD